MLSVSVAALPNIQVPGGQSVLAPLTGIDSNGGPITYTFQTDDSSVPVTLSLVSPTSQSLQLQVSGTDKDGNAFSVTLIFHLFEDLTPNATSQIESLVGSNFYDGSEFFRVIDGFVAQNNTGSSGTTFGNEIVSTLNFNSPGLLAFANTGAANSNDSEFFVTAIDKAGSTDPITLARDPQYLDGGYTIFGQLVSGFDTFEKIMSVPVEASSNFNGEVSQPVNRSRSIRPRLSTTRKMRC
jgi:cyclophilin family peptidyl-prolyl cis-trans isomerase